MRSRPPLATARLWTAIGLLFIALFAAAPASMATPAVPHLDHHASATGVLDHFASVDHEHIAPAVLPGAPEALADALVPRVRPTLLALGLVFAIAVLGGMFVQHRILVGRDPPRSRSFTSPGRTVLAQLCIARR